MPKLAGHFKGVPIYEDPAAPPDTMYLLNNKEVGTPGFRDVMHNRHAVLRDVDNTAGEVYYQHIYRTNFAGKYRVHACMAYGSWCWRQIARHPIQSLRQWRMHKHT